MFYWEGRQPLRPLKAVEVWGAATTIKLPVSGAMHATQGRSTCIEVNDLSTSTLWVQWGCRMDSELCYVHTMQGTVWYWGSAVDGSVCRVVQMSGVLP
jgi:hypothetical protein